MRLRDVGIILLRHAERRKAGLRLAGYVANDTNEYFHGVDLLPRYSSPIATTHEV